MEHTGIKRRWGTEHTILPKQTLEIEIYKLASLQLSGSGGSKAARRVRAGGASTSLRLHRGSAGS